MPCVLPGLGGEEDEGRAGRCDAALQPAVEPEHRPAALPFAVVDERILGLGEPDHPTAALDEQGRRVGGGGTAGGIEHLRPVAAFKEKAANIASRKKSPNAPSCTAVYTYWLCGLSVNGMWLENFQLIRA